MAYVCSATWISKETAIETVRNALAMLAPASRLEAGNLCYYVYQSPESPAVFKIFEIYTDEAAFKAHTETEHFKIWALQTAIPVLAERHREFYETLDV